MHFVAVCEKYPAFAFNVPKMRPSFDRRGRKQDSTMVHFTNGVVDTLALDLTEAEAALVRERLLTMTSTPPRVGVEIRLSEAAA